ncbi:hypothetical protein C7441_112179 [Pseudaminobacter salicylatoxidans]|uniref:Uncharacterized protein n=1 Tax=Pseudaminobacter salicylatoxidans TaxID=93369 RepID=A0A316BZV0_PSESE|nr:hypothetical protein [Pseudaminobacter salicylatoxidans]PWJ80637.1 hypothetical protein C7441_112179 [Pseudaminobacter salicylatoxidans]
MKVTNISKALQGVNGKSGRVFIRPGDTKEVEFDDVGLNQAKRLTKLLSIEKGDAGAAPEGGGVKTAAEVLAMADNSDIPFMSFKSAASKLLGERTPAKKDEIVTALMELATNP